MMRFGSLVRNVHDQALVDCKSGKNKSIGGNLLSNIQNIEPISMIKTEGLGDIPAKDIVEKMGISHQDDPKLEDVTKEIYSKEFYEGILANNTKQFAGKKISEAKDEIKMSLWCRMCCEIIKQSMVFRLFKQRLEKESAYLF